MSVRLTVLMPVYQVERYVTAAVRSILRQSAAEFRLLILDDASSDGTLAQVRRIRDPRIRIECNAVNLGLAATLNRGLEMIDTEYIARMDGDDLSHPRRLAWQTAFMDARPEVGLSGTWLQTFGGWGPRHLCRYPETMPAIRVAMLFGSPVAHATLIFRRQELERHQLRYDPRFSRSEDFDLCVRASRQLVLANLARCAYRYRQHPGGATTVGREAMVAQVRVLIRRQLEALGIGPDDEQLDLHGRAVLGRGADTPGQLRRAGEWFEALALHLEGQAAFAGAPVRETIARVWFTLCSLSTPLGREAWRCYAATPLAASCPPGWPERVRFGLGVVRQALLPGGTS